MHFVLIPVKALAVGKSRLSSLLSATARSALARAMLTDVLTSALQAPSVDGVVVVSSDATLLTLARQLGAFTVDEESPRGLNGAVTLGTDFCVQRGATALLVLLADVPLVTAEDITTLFHSIDDTAEIILVPCKEGDGTNAVLRVPPLIVGPCFGGPSLAAYQDAARRHGVSCRMIERPGLAFDLDSVADVQRFMAHPTATETYRVLRGQETGYRGQGTGENG